MKNHFGFLAVAVVFSTTAHSKSSWRIDDIMKFNFTYYPQKDSIVKGQRVQKMNPLLKHIPAHSPDIDNISYKALLDLEFPLPKEEDPENLNFLLKLYPFPHRINHHLSAARVLRPFGFEGMQSFPEIQAYLARKENIAVKFAVLSKKGESAFTAKNPLEAFTLSGEQLEFDRAIPFTSIYLGPTSPSQKSSVGPKVKAARSTSGVESFHQELLTHYRAHFTELQGSEKSFFFSSANSCVDSPRLLCALSVIELPKEILKFDNYQTLPMPHEPSKIFLTGLLLLKSTSVNVRDLNISADELAKTSVKKIYQEGKLNSSHLLEVGSVVKF